jgi:hypothetical protein
MKVIAIIIGGVVYLTSSLSIASDTFAIESHVRSKTEGASCYQLGANMNEALDARDDAETKKKLSMAATAASTLTALIPIPYLATGAALGRSAAFNGAHVHDPTPELLYRESYRLYKDKGCSPKVAFGKRVPAYRKPSSNQESSINSEKISIANVQQALNARGYSAGPADGLIGARTKLALKNFQEDNGLRESGMPDDETLYALGLKQKNGSWWSGWSTNPSTSPSEAVFEH